MLELLEDAPRRGHADGEDDQGVCEGVLVEGIAEQAGVTGVAVHDPYAQPCVICK